MSLQCSNGSTSAPEPRPHTSGSGPAYFETVGHFFRSGLKDAVLSGWPPLIRWLGLLCGTFCFSFSIPAAAAEVSDARVIFIGPANPALYAALHDALTAQLSGAPIELQFSRFERDDQGLREQLALAQRLSREQHALGVFWIDARVQNDWVVYLLAEGPSTRVLARHVNVEEGVTDAATEAVAVITRESSEGLRNGQVVRMQPVSIALEEPPAPAPAPCPAPPAPLPLGEFRGPLLFVGYRGDYFSKDLDWQSGLRVAAGFRFASGVYVTGGYSFLQDAQVESGDFGFLLRRIPVDLGIGFGRRFGRFVPAIEIRGLAEFLSRDNLSTGSAYEATEGGTRLMAFFSPRLRLDVALSRTISLGVAGGIDVALNEFSFVSREDTVETVVLDPAGVRPAIEVGITVWP